ncbi:putative uncharacterized protein DDB_G0271606 isoform X2 [Symsagittifera roscoffensis]|uniref:putative uncharacterized protein DDB_G0271606 isoform X2 n=1 Tax=Symsagittifera roscoffensis TaxID=84072 RepID=UPI00307C0AB2
MYSTFSSRQNPNLPRILVLLLVILLLALFYQHYSNKQVQGVLERDISFGQQRAKQVERELDAIQKGLQMDLNKEKSENEKVRSELQNIKLSMEQLQSVQSSKDRTCQEYFDDLQGCRSQKKLTEDNVNQMQANIEKASSDSYQLNRQIEQLQNKMAEKDQELQRLQLKIQGLQSSANQNAMAQNRNQYNGNQPNYQMSNNNGQPPRYDQNIQQQGQPQQQQYQQQAQNVNYQPVYNKGPSDQDKSRQVLSEVEKSKEPSQQQVVEPNQVAAQQNVESQNGQKSGGDNSPGEELPEMPANWRGQDHNVPVEGHNEQMGPVALDALAKDQNDEHEGAGDKKAQAALKPNEFKTNGTKTEVKAAPGQIDEGGLKQIGAPGEDKQVENAAEVDFVPGDGQGALLPPMGEAERKAMDNRIDNGQAQANLAEKREEAGLDQPVGFENDAEEEEDEEENKQERYQENEAAEVDQRQVEEGEEEENEEENEAADTGGDRMMEVNAENRRQDYEKKPEGEVQFDDPLEDTNEEHGEEERQEMPNAADNALGDDFNDENARENQNIPDFEQNKK